VSEITDGIEVPPDVSWVDDHTEPIMGWPCCRCGHPKSAHAMARHSGREIGCLHGWAAYLGESRADWPEAAEAPRKCACMTYRPRRWWNWMRR
jgi:hypothetical protein